MLSLNLSYVPSSKKSTLFVIGISALPCWLIVSLSEVMPSGAPTICCLPVLLPDPVTLTFDLPKLFMISVNKVSDPSVSVD